NLLWVISGHWRVGMMSAVPPKADIPPTILSWFSAPPAPFAGRLAPKSAKKSNQAAPPVTTSKAGLTRRRAELCFLIYRGACGAPQNCRSAGWRTRQIGAAKQRVIGKGALVIVQARRDDRDVHRVQNIFQHRLGHLRPPLIRRRDRSRVVSLQSCYFVPQSFRA